VKINAQKCFSLLGGVIFLGTVLLPTNSAQGQTVYAEVASNGIYEVSGGTVTPTPISGVGTGGLAVDSSGDIFFVNNNNLISEYTSGGVQQTFGLPLEPDYAPTGYTIAGVDNEGKLWGIGREGLYSFYPYPTAPPPALVGSAGPAGPAATVNSTGQVFFEYLTGYPPNGVDIYQLINGSTVSLVYNTGYILTAIAFDNAGDMYGINFLAGPYNPSILEYTPSGGVSGVTGSPSGATCLALDSAGDLFVGCSNGDIDEITTGGLESTVATLDGPVEGLVVVPEPSVLGLLSVGAMIFLLRRRFAQA
jgi:hypothetical protein